MVVKGEGPDRRVCFICKILWVKQARNVLGQCAQYSSGRKLAGNTVPENYRGVGLVIFNVILDAEFKVEISQLVPCWRKGGIGAGTLSSLLQQ